MIRLLRAELSLFWLALQLLTRLPTPPTDDFSPVRLAAAARHYPSVGLVVGAFTGLVFWAAAWAFSPGVAALLATALGLLVTGAFHEDGLADVFDGLGAGDDRARALEIMRDSRLGAFGVAALGIALALKVTTLAAPAATVAAPMLLIAGHVGSRASMTLAMAASRPARADGVAAAAQPDLVAACVCAVVGVFALLLVAWTVGVATALGAGAGAVIGHFLARALYERRLGGYTGDCLGAVQQLSEIGLYLGALAALRLAGA